MSSLKNLTEQLKECKKIRCTNLFLFKEQEEFFVRWEGEFIDDNTGLPMQLIIPKLSMNLLCLNTHGFNFKNVAVGCFEIKPILNENEQDTLFTILFDKENKDELYR